MLLAAWMILMRILPGSLMRPCPACAVMRRWRTESSTSWHVGSRGVAQEEEESSTTWHFGSPGDAQKEEKSSTTRHFGSGSSAQQEEESSTTWHLDSKGAATCTRPRECEPTARDCSTESNDLPAGHEGATSRYHFQEGNPILWSLDHHLPEPSRQPIHQSKLVVWASLLQISILLRLRCILPGGDPTIALQAFRACACLAAQNVCNGTQDNMLHTTTDYQSKGMCPLTLQGGNNGSSTHRWRATATAHLGPALVTAALLA
jgi:hypothetical protein